MTDIRGEVAAGVQDGVRQLLADDKLVSAFWATGYKALSEHASDNASQWIGRRILTWFAVSVVMALLAWLVKSGAIK